MIVTLRVLAAVPPGLICRLFRKHVWIITERPDQARDNGYVFFRYLREKHPEISVYYIIAKDAPDREKIERYGHVIAFDSRMHFFYYCLSTVHISAHVNGCLPSRGLICRNLKPFLRVRDVFLPHGVSCGISEFCLKKYAKLDLFVCAGEPEYRNVLENYGYTEKELALTGFPRLDLWQERDTRAVDPKQILLMPTWRLYLARNPETVFENTQYYRAYEELLSSERLHRFLAENDLRLIFYPHHEMRKFQGAFTTACGNIEIVRETPPEGMRAPCGSRAPRDIQELLMTSALLITDYSSVHFDFAYMEKPVLYYRFDEEMFFRKQYQKGNFDPERDGFGPVYTNLSGLLDGLERAYAGGFAMAEPYHSRMRAFYKLYDSHNCDRVFDAIRERIDGA